MDQEFEKMQLRKMLEKGGEKLKENANVYVYRCVVDGKDYVVKRIKKRRNQKNVDRQQNYCKKLINKDYIVKIHDVWKTGHDLFICMDYYRSDMKKFILENWQLLEENPAIPFLLFLQYLFALTHLRVMHRDIKPQNSFVSEENGQYKLYLSDFGQCNNGQIYAKSYVGTYQYQAPEINSRRSGLLYGRKADVWSLGITLFQLFNGKKKNVIEQEEEDLRFPYGKHPFFVFRNKFKQGEEQREKPEKQIEKLEECIPYSIPLPKRIPHFISDLIRRMLDQEQKNRCSFERIYEILSENRKGIEEMLGQKSEKWLEEIQKYKKEQKMNIEFYKSQEILRKSVEQLYQTFYRCIKEFSLAKRYHKLLRIFYFGIDQLLNDYIVLKNQFHLNTQILNIFISDAELKNVKVLHWDLLAKLGYIEPKSKTQECKSRSNLQQYWSSPKTQQQLHSELTTEKIAQIWKVYSKHVLDKLPL